MCRRCTPSPPSPVTWTPTTSPGADLPSTPGRYVSRTCTTGSGTISGSALLQARPAVEAHSYITCNPKIPSFLEDAAAGTLPSVSWIDPAFTNFNPLGFPVDDDHPMADVEDGQDLVLAIYDALAASPQWKSSLLVIVYDEHGGFSITSRRRRPPTTIPRRSAVRRSRASDHRLAVDRPRGVTTPCSITPRSSKRCCSVLARALDRAAARPWKAGQRCLDPQYPGLHVARPPSRGTASPRRAPARPGPRYFVARSRGAGWAGRSRTTSGDLRSIACSNRSFPPRAG